jgi:G3E family GTPase
MTKLYLVTGFLGAGKTTFLQRFVTLFHDQKLALVINEFGKRGVDGLLLSHLNTSINEINNGSIFCACRLEEFEHALLELQTQQPDVIIVEASGLSDPTTVGTILGQKDRFPDIEYAGAICVADGVRFHKVYQTARVCKMQLAVSDLVLINKADVATQDHIDEIKTVALAQKPNRPVHETTYGEMKQEWLEELRTPNEEDGSTAIHTHDVTLQKLSLRPMGFSSMELAVFLKRIAEDTYRIKGTVALTDGMFLIDCVGPLVSLKMWGGTEITDLAVLFGNGQPARKSIQNAREWLPHCTVELV